MQSFVNLKLLNYIIAVLELNDIIDKRLDAIRKGNYGAAAVLLEKEKDIRATMMSIEDMKKMRDEMVKYNKQIEKP